MSGITRSSGGRRLWLLEIELGRVYRFSTESVVVEHTFGPLTVEHLYEAGLEEPGVSFAAVDAREEVSVPVTVVSSEDWALLVAQGNLIEARRATLLRWEEGTRYERAKVVIRGTIVGVSYGEAGEPLTFSIRRSLYEAADILPPPQAVIDATTWPDASLGGSWFSPDSSQGTPYPIVIGSPGYNGAGRPGRPAMAVKYAQYGITTGGSYIVVGDGEIAAKQCRLYVMNDDRPTPIITSPDTRSITQVTDNLGRTVSVTTADAQWVDAEFMVGFPQAAGGGVKHRGEPIRGAGSVLRWLLEGHLDARVDWGRTNAVLDRLDAYKIDTFLDTPTNIWEWFVDEVLPILPIEIRESANGLYPFLWRYDATAVDAGAHLDATPGTGRVVRVSPLVSTGEVYNEITIEYGGDDRVFRRMASSSARAPARSASPDADSRVRGSSLLTASQTIYGIRPLTLQAPAVWDHATAELVLRDRILQHAFPRRTVSYSGGDWLETLGLGDVVTVTDPGVYLENAVALVTDLTPRGDEVTVDLLLLDHLLRGTRATD